MPGTVCVTGATSQIGVFLLTRLRAAGFDTVAVSRRAQDPPADPHHGVRWLRPAAPALVESPVDALVSCGPLVLAAQLAREMPGIRRVVAFSSSSVIAKAYSGNARERRAMAAMRADEARLLEACRRRDLPLLLLRPTLIYGCGRDRNVSTLKRLGERFGVIPLAGRAAGLRQPVHADDLAALAVSALRRPEALRLESPACGGETLTYREMAVRIAALSSPPARLLSLPAAVFAAAVSLASLWPGLRGLNAEMVRRQGQDLVFDDSGLRRLLGWNPRPFRPMAEDFAVPDEAMLLQLE